MLLVSVKSADFVVTLNSQPDLNGYPALFFLNGRDPVGDGIIGCYENVDNPAPDAKFSNPEIGGTVKVVATAPVASLHVQVTPKNGKVVLLERYDGGVTGSTHTYEYDITTWGKPRALHVLTDIFCSAGHVLPVKDARLLNVGGWSEKALYGIRLL